MNRPSEEQWSPRWHSFQRTLASRVVVSSGANSPRRESAQAGHWHPPCVNWLAPGEDRIAGPRN